LQELIHLGDHSASEAVRDVLVHACLTRIDQLRRRLRG
jgi:hypothetical protein